MWRVSPAYLDAESLLLNEKLMLLLFGFFFPPIPFYVMSGPQYTIKTKEFVLALVLTFTFWGLAVVYMAVFVWRMVPKARLLRAGYIALDESEPVIHEAEPPAYPGDNKIQI